jgi:IMP dehydrogenase
MKLALSFDDVLLSPKFSNIVSRSEEHVDTTVMFCGEKLLTPMISSNMDSVTGSTMAAAVARAGGVGALHRFWSIEDNVEAYKQSPAHTIVSIGLGNTELERAKALYDSGAFIFLIDVAHGASMPVVEQTRQLQQMVAGNAAIIVGNFATADTLLTFTEKLGNTDVQAFKIGIGGGSACLTRVVTGVGWPTLASLLDCATTGFPLIADGGIRNSGDMAKAIAAGATTVMCGRLFAGCSESPGNLCDKDGNELKSNSPASLYKKYRGSASAESYTVQGKVASHRTPEGDSFLVPWTGPVAKTMQAMEGGLRSMMSYLNSNNIGAIKDNSEFVQITSHGAIESNSHGRNS